MLNFNHRPLHHQRFQDSQTVALELRDLFAHYYAIDFILEGDVTQEQADEFYMQKTYELAQHAGVYYDEVPVACLIVRERQIIGAGINLTITTTDPTAHAEIVAIRNAAHNLDNYRLLDCDLYVTLEPCPMCAGAILQARCQRVIYGSQDLKTGAIGGIYNLFADFRVNHKPQITRGIMGEEISKSISSYFATKRKSNS